MSTSFASNFSFLQSIIDNEEDSAIKSILSEIMVSGSSSEKLYAYMPHASIIFSGVACEQIAKFYMMKQYPEKGIMLKKKTLAIIWGDEDYYSDWTSTKGDLKQYVNLYYLKGEYNHIKHGDTNNIQKFDVPNVDKGHLEYDEDGKIAYKKITPVRKKILTKENALRRSKDVFDYLCTALIKCKVLDEAPGYSTPPELTLEGNDFDPAVLDAFQTAVEGLSDLSASQEGISGVLNELDSKVDELKRLSSQFDSMDEISSRLSSLEETLERLADNSRHSAPPAPVPVRKLDEKEEKARKKKELEKKKKEREKKRSKIKTPGVLVVITLIAVYLAAALVLDLPLHEKILPAFLNTWLKQYVLWGIASFSLLLTLLFALKRVKEVSWCVFAAVLFALLMMWPTVLGGHGLIKDISYSPYGFYEPLWLNEGESASPTVTPLLCSHARLTYTSSDRDVNISPYGTVTLSESGKDCLFVSPYIKAFHHDLKAGCALIVDNTDAFPGKTYRTDKNGAITYSFGSGERGITIHRWIFAAKVRDEKGHIPNALTKLKIEAQRQNGEWVTLKSWDDVGDPLYFETPDNGTIQWPVIGDETYYSMFDKFNVTMRFDGFSGDDLIIWSSFEWIDDSVEILDEGNGY